MILPTPAEVIAIKTACARRFGAARPYAVRLDHPIDACVVVAVLDLKSYSAHVDARQGGPAKQTIAASAVVVDRLLWCSPQAADAPTIDTMTPTKEEADPVTPAMLDRLEELREEWPAVDGNVDDELRVAAGGGMAVQPIARLTEGNAPAGFTIPADAKTRGPGALWLASWSSPTSSLSIVMRAPLPDVWSSARGFFFGAIAKGEGVVAASMRFAAEHIVWSPEPMAEILDRLPAVGLSMREPFLAMGGEEAESSGTFL